MRLDGRDNARLTPFGNMHVKIVVDPVAKREREVFAQLGKGGDLANSDLEAICRLTSLYLRVHGSIEDVVSQLSGIGSSLSIPTEQGRIASLADGLSHAIRHYLDEKDSIGLEGLLLGRVAAGPVHGRKASKGSREADATRGFAVKCSQPECNGSCSSRKAVQSAAVVDIAVAEDDALGTASHGAR